MTETSDVPQIGTGGTPRVVVIANGLFRDQLAGGDIHLLHALRGFALAGLRVECLSGRVLERFIHQWNIRAAVIHTDRETSKVFDDNSLRGRVCLFFEFLRRLISTILKLRRIGPDDVCFCGTDYWFDVLPMILSRARLKVMVLQMKAPSFEEVVLRSRADVEPARVSSLYFSISQCLSIALLRLCENKRVICVQPLLQTMLRERNFGTDELPLIPNGIEREAVLPDQTRKDFDVVWMGRIHRQKGIGELLDTLVYLSEEIPDFRALLIGNVRHALQPEIERLGIGQNVEFAGFLSGAEKFQWLRRARVFLMTSRHEGLPLVLGEALACELPVVAFELEMYRPFYGDQLTYIRPFDVTAFKAAAAEHVRRTRNGEVLVNRRKLEPFVSNLLWPEIEKQLVAVVSTP